MARKATTKRPQMTPELPFPKGRGGARTGAGRKAELDERGKRLHSTHSKRPVFTRHRPLLVTVNFVQGLPSLRRADLGARGCAAIQAGNQREDFRVVHLALLSNHLHMICEADGPEALARGMKGLGGRIAKAVNAVLRRKGAVVSGRYDLQVLRSLEQVRHAVAYVLRNGEHHGIGHPWRTGDGVPTVDRWTSAAWFSGWSDPVLNVPEGGCGAGVVRPARCYLMYKAFEVDGLSYRDPIPGIRKRHVAMKRRAREDVGATRAQT